MTRDIWYWLFIFVALLLGWVVGRGRDKFQFLHKIIEGLRLERDAQARTIEHQRKVIRELENRGGHGIGAFRGAFAKSDAAVSIAMPCKIPPTGWYCTRDAGHEGPCAALPLGENKDQ